LLPVFSPVFSPIFFPICGSYFARGPLPRGLAIGECDGPQTIECLRNRKRGQAFADAGWAREDQAGRQRLARHRSREQRDDPPVADDISKRHE
jgi:hypothetical protein